jgi:enoyl-[acyl-carrier-protein] reductase (NADH)
VIRGDMLVTEGEMLEAEDVAKAALFLMGDESRHITGQVLMIDGGWAVSS